MADERVEIARIAADFVLGQHGAEEDGVRPAVFRAQAVRADKAIRVGVIDGKIDLFQRLVIELGIARQVAAFQGPVDPVAGLFVGPPGIVRAFGIVLLAAPELVAIGIAGDGHVAGQAGGLALQKILQPPGGTDPAQGYGLKTGKRKRFH